MFRAILHVQRASTRRMRLYETIADALMDASKADNNLFLSERSKGFDVDHPLDHAKGECICWD
jgi:hypothetical protein